MSSTFVTENNTLRIALSLLQPMRSIPGSNPPRYELEQSQEYVEIDLDEMPGPVPFTQPVRITGTEIIIDPEEFSFDLSGETKCIAFQWTENNLNAWLGRLTSILGDEGPPVENIITLRILFSEDDETSLEEIRLDWTIAGGTRTFTLPGVKVDIPTSTMFSVLLGAGNGGLNDLALALTVPQNSEIIARSTFAWLRDISDGNLQPERELNNDDEQASDAEPLFKLSLTAEQRVSFALLQTNLEQGGLPTFLKQLTTPLEQLDLTADSLCDPTPFDPVSLSEDTWEGTFKVALDQFKFPFLKDDNDNPAANQFSQFIQLKPPVDQQDPEKKLLNTFDLDFVDPSIVLPFVAVVKFGTLQLETELVFSFNWETFAISVNHGEGIALFSQKESYKPPQEHMGLTWRLEGAPVEDQAGVYQYFTLVTKGYAYELQQAPGAKFVVAYTKASREPIEFIISNFSLTPKGITLTAEVSDEPVRMNGIDTRFRFHGSKLTIVENKIADFTLAGSGPLPPDLVGEAMVDIALQFKQQAGNLTLVSGGAHLKGNKLLDCKNTRFQFSVDAIGLDFVNENGFHLYFKITGSARFVLAPGDNKEGALAWLPNIQIDLVEAPLTGDVSVIAKHIKFLIELPKPLTFNFLGCFEMELRGIGFMPTAEEFNGDAGMELTGQLRFAQGAGDTPDPRTDYHRLLIGLPEPGKLFPRIYFKRISLNLNVGSAFKLNGYVEFIDDKKRGIEGFEGEGMLELQGMPSIAASFAFLRVRRNEDSTWLRAWFIYLEVRRFSLMIPVIQIYLREVGLGFGYRFTLASIKVADRENDVKKLLKELQKLSRTQGDLSKRDRWEVDLEKPGEDLRWTIVFRALISQMSAAPSPLQYDKDAEEQLANLFLIDAIIAFRSDLTFFMAARAWLYTNYADFDSKPTAEVKEKPFLSGFVLLSPRQKRFLMHVSSNKEGYIGDHPPMPDFVKTALKSVRFSATLLIEPGLVHFELGWPNMLGWDFDIGPLRVSIRGGFIFRVSREEFAIGISYEARGKLDVKAEVDLGLVGVRVSVYAEVGYGARLIALVKLADQNFFFHGGIGLEMRIVLSIELWIKIPLIFTTIKLTFRFSIGIAFTAGLEAGLTKNQGLGLRGRGTLALSAMGHSIQFSASFAFNEGAVITAEAETRHILNVGLEATDVPPVPGLGEPASLDTEFEAGFSADGAALSGDTGPVEPAFSSALSAPDALPPTLEAVIENFKIPGYSIFVIRRPDKEGWSYFVLLPQGEDQIEQVDGSTLPIEQGFLPAPPLNLRLRLKFYSTALDRGVLPDDLNALFVGEFALENPTPVVYRRTSMRWLVIDETQNRRAEYDITLSADPKQDPHATLSASLRERIDISTPQIQDSLPIPFGILNPILFANYLHTNLEGNPEVDLDTIRILDEGRIVHFTSVGGSDYSVLFNFKVNRPHIFYFEHIYEVQSVWERASANDVVFENVPADEQTARLQAGQLPDVAADILDGAETPQEDTGSDTWRWTVERESAEYVITKSPDEGGIDLRYMDIRLQVTSDFTLTIPKTDPEYLFSVPASLAGTLDAAMISEDLSNAFSDFNFPLDDNAQVKVVTPGEEWTLNDVRVDPETSQNIDIFYYIFSEDEFLNVHGDMTLEQYDPFEGWQSRAQHVREGGSVSWRVNWDANIYDGAEYNTTPVDLSDQEAVDQQNAQLQNTTPEPVVIKLGRHLNHAFELYPFVNGGGQPDPEGRIDQVIPLSDPPMPEIGRRLEDERVQNPSDDAFEAAVRGAVEQFEGSPFFKLDPNNEYDRLLGEAFDTDTTIYDSGGALPENGEALEEHQTLQQAIQLRGMVIHDLVADLRDYAQSRQPSRTPGANGADPIDRSRSIPFQMGLVFRYQGKPPAWLDDLVPSEDEKLAIQQRRGPFNAMPDPEMKPAKTFNIWQTDFAKNPPQFQRVRQYSNASTIAITWDLTWPQQPREGVTPNQAEPEHHLLHYQVQRRALDGSERDITFSLKNADVVHRENPGDLAITRLHPRFQLVDHFSGESEKELAELPVTGRSYLYTITPVDFDDNAGRPLTLVATRRPSIPPLVPVDGEFIVTYRLSPNQLTEEAADLPTTPQIVTPASVEVRWQEPYDSRSGATVPIAGYRLIFRRELTMPIGSYGLDSSTQRPAVKALPTSNARRLPTDILLDIDTSAVVEKIHPGEDVIRKGVVIPLTDLQSAGVLPEKEWLAESWRVFFQTESVNRVPSALAPVQLLLVIEPQNGTGYEMRRPAELEWLPAAINFPLLPPEDERAVVGMAHFPMPGQDNTSLDSSEAENTGDFHFIGSLKNVGFRLHPAELRLARFRWNQGPSDQPDYPLDLNAGYRLYELDVDAGTTETFATAENLREALRGIQEVQMMPAEDLLLAPGDTLNASQWEAWYPSILMRLRTAEQRAAKRSKTILGPWYSWRESLLEWPAPALREEDTTNGVFSVDLVSHIATRRLNMHPVLARVMWAMRRIFTVDFQSSPPLQPGELSDFMAATSDATDPYGWNVLQHFGLSVAFTARKASSGELLTGDDLLHNVQIALVAGMLTYALIDDVRLYVGQDNPTRDVFEEQILPLCEEQIKAAVKQLDDQQSFSEVMVASVDSLVDAIDVNVPHRVTFIQLLTESTRPALQRLSRHLFVELLFQPGRSIDLSPRAAEGADTLAIVQVSLRPVVRQVLRYGKIDISGAAKGSVTLSLKLGKVQVEGAPVDQPCSFINQNDPASGQSELESDEPGQPITRKIVLPLNGETMLYFRSAVLPTVGITLPLENTQDVKVPGNLSAHVNFTPAVGTKVACLTIAPSFSTTTKADRRALLNALDEGDRDAAEILLTLKFTALVEVSPTHESEIASEFIVPSNLPQLLSSTDAGSGGRAWYRLKYYLESLNGPENPKIVLPTNPLGETSIEKLLPDFLAWSARFFNAGGNLVEENGLGSTHAGVWLATAYPRAGSPAYATPDAGGRLKYDHLYQDKYAHNLRYYIQPYGRYDLLWHSFRQSPALSPDGATPDERVMRPLPDPAAGGLDIVIDRTQAVDAPVILNSTRLDPVTEPGQPVPPGKVWEVIIAQHPEQSLIERNQTLARQLAFRQIAFTLLRNYSYQDWLSLLNRALREHNPEMTTIEVTAVHQQEQSPDIPGEYPLLPDHIDFSAETLSTDDVNSVALPTRIGSFQQGALVLQWEALPFYYEHRLLTIAQTATTVSEINEISQRDFEYRTPKPAAIAEGFEPPVNISIDGLDFPPANPQALPIRLRRVGIPLRTFWDSLTSETQARWEDETPDTPESEALKRKFSALPDPDVIYQLVETFSGNVEVQIEVFFGREVDEQTDEQGGNYVMRQLGRGTLAVANSLKVLPPPTTHEDITVVLDVVQLTPLELVQNYDLPASLGRAFVTIEDTLYLVGAFTAAQYAVWQSLLDDPADATQVAALYERFTSREPVSFAPQIPDELSPQSAVEEDVIVHLVWDSALSAAADAPISNEEREALLALPGDEAFIKAIARLVEAIDQSTAGDVSYETAPLPPAFLDENELPDGFGFAKKQDGSGYQLSRTGLLNPDELAAAREALYAWAKLPELRRAVDELLAMLETAVVRVPNTRARLKPEDIPDVLKGKLLIDGDIFSFNGELTPEAEAAFNALIIAHPGSDLALTLTNLLMAAKRVSFSVDFTLDELSPNLLDKLPEGLEIETLGGDQHRLRWVNPLPDAEQFEVLKALLQDQELPLAFREGLEKMLALMSDGAAAMLSPRTTEIAIRIIQLLQSEGSILSNKLVLSGAVGNKPFLHWIGLVPTDEERDALNELLEREEKGHLRYFRAGLRHLLAIIDGKPKILMPAMPQSTLPQLTITDNEFHWTGLVVSDEDQTELVDLSQQGDVQFEKDIEVLENSLANSTTAIDLVIPDRPDGLPEILAGKLIVSRWRLRYGGLMTPAEGGSLRALFMMPIDKNAVQRLYTRNVNAGLRDRVLKIRARRGGAAPSPMNTFVTRPLTNEE